MGCQPVPRRSPRPPWSTAEAGRWIPIVVDIDTECELITTEDSSERHNIVYWVDDQPQILEFGV